MKWSNSHLLAIALSSVALALPALPVNAVVPDALENSSSGVVSAPSAQSLGDSDHTVQEITDSMGR